MFVFILLGSYEHHLLSVHNSSSGFGVSLATLNGGLFSETFSSLYLPPECGEDFSRCKDLLVDSNELDENVTQFVAIIPATHAVVILDIHHNGSALVLNNFYRVNQTIIDCNPTAVFKVGASYYTMCVKGMSYLTILELHLDPHSIQDAYFSQPARERFRFGNDHELSNFLSVDLGSIYGSVGRSHQIVFVAQNWFYAYEAISAQTRYGPSIQCQPNKIEYAGEGEVLAYCDDRSLYINITNWQIKTTFYNDSGFPYLCPNYSRIQLSTIHNSSNVTFLKYRALQGGQTTEKEIPILGNGGTLYTNQCFGTRTTYFAYSTSDSIHIVDIISEIDHTVSLHKCLGPWCLSVIGGQYLIVQEPTQAGTNISVLDAQQNLAPVVRTHGQQADLAALILTRKSTEPAPNPSSTTTLALPSSTTQMTPTMTLVHPSSAPQMTPTATPIQNSAVTIAVSISICVVMVVLLTLVVLIGVIW